MEYNELVDYEKKETKNILPYPRLEVREFFYIRTEKHIKQVKQNMNYIFKKLKNKKGIDRRYFIHRRENHDRSKYRKDIIIPYMWITWKYNGGKLKWKMNKEDISLAKKEMRKAINKHKKLERHHIDFYRKVKYMKKLDLIEMISDCGAVSIELNDNLIEWSKSNILNKKWTKKQKKFLKKIIRILNKRIVKVQEVFHG